MGLIPIWRGTIRVPEPITQKTKIGSSVLSHRLYESFEAAAEIFASPETGYDIIKTSCKPPFDEMRLRHKGARKTEQDHLVLAFSGEGNWLGSGPIEFSS